MNASDFVVAALHAVVVVVAVVAVADDDGDDVDDDDDSGEGGEASLWFQPVGLEVVGSSEALVDATDEQDLVVTLGSIDVADSTPFEKEVVVEPVVDNIEEHNIVVE